MRRTGSRGFTLIELMVALSVLVILLLLALPNFSEKAMREQIAEALPLADLAKPPLEEAWKSSLPLPADNAAAGLPPAEKIVNQWVSSVTVKDGAIHIVFGNKANRALQGKTLTLRPAGVADARIVPVTWLCGRATAPPQMTAQGQDRTDIPAQVLPVRCR